MEGDGWEGDLAELRRDDLIAAVAMRADLAILHADRDFDVLARHGVRIS